MHDVWSREEVKAGDIVKKHWPLWLEHLGRDYTPPCIGLNRARSNRPGTTLRHLMSGLFICRLGARVWESGKEIWLWQQNRKTGGPRVLHFLYVPWLMCFSSLTHHPLILWEDRFTFSPILLLSWRPAYWYSCTVPDVKRYPHGPELCTEEFPSKQSLFSSASRYYYSSRKISRQDLWRWKVSESIV